MPAAIRRNAEQETRRWRRQQAFVPVLARLGIERWLLKRSSLLKLMPEEQREEAIYLGLKPAFLETSVAEYRSFEESGEQARASGTFGDKPLIVLTSRKTIEAGDVPRGVSREEFQEAHDFWVHEMQMRLVRLSSRGKQIIIPNGRHMLALTWPQPVISAIREVTLAAELSPDKKTDGGARAAAADPQN
ncbi:MAG: hypothetical protein LAN84_16535 [Acidobacteriia bacterium]|nr:hypothetical protein [Terriglobia bacterium]